MLLAEAERVRLAGERARYASAFLCMLHPAHLSVGLHCRWRVHDADRSYQVGSSATIPSSILVHLGRQCQQRDLRLFPTSVNPSFEVTEVKSKMPSTSKPGHTSSQNSLNALSKQQSENTRDHKKDNSEVG